MKLAGFNADEKVFTLQLSQLEIENLIMYLGHGRHAKGLDYLNYENLGWKESAEVAKQQRNAIEAVMAKFNEILNTPNNEIQH